jgi:hypothetical protein
MGIYINIDSAKREDVERILHCLEEKYVECYNCCERRLAEVENECSACFIDLRMFDNTRVNLRSGGLIGLSYWFKMSIFTIINPTNIKLKNDLGNIGAHVFDNEEQAVNVLRGISEKIRLAEREVRAKKTVESRNDVRETIRNFIKADIDVMLLNTQKINNLKQHL